ncbi:MAG: hypothetical protein KC478_07215 [Bacteriovoracaceae bacterium]|nr:hypothetical protein [Bacteriovoracaceae bacterium]
MSSIKDEWIFYLKLSPKLPENFLFLDENFKQFGFNLIPVSFPNLLELIKTDETFHVVTIISSQKEAGYYMKHVSKHIKNLLRFRKINFFTASSFDFINESSKLTFRDNYEFHKLPIQSSVLCDNIITTVLDKAVENTKWPGGKRPKMSIAG